MRPAPASQSPACRLLFVYGTLMPTATSVLGGIERARLAAVAVDLGPATVCARLYDLGGYPGLVPDPAGTVEGELLELADPDATWPWLDAYEGVAPAGGSATDEYRRQIVPVRLLSDPNQDMAAWAYVMAREPAGLTPLPMRRWVA